MKFDRILHFAFPPVSLVILFVLQVTGWTRWGDNQEPVAPADVDWGQLLLMWAGLQVLYYASAAIRHRRAKQGNPVQKDQFSGRL